MPRAAPDSSKTETAPRVGLELARTFLAQASATSTEEACLLLAFQIASIGAVCVCTLRHGGGAAADRAIWALSLPAAYGSSAVVYFDPPVYCPIGVGMDFSGSGANPIGQIQVILVDEHPVMRRGQSARPERTASGRLISGPIFQADPPSKGSLGGGVV